MRILFSRIALKDISTTLKIRDQGINLPISVSNRVVSPYCESFIFPETYGKFLGSFAKIKSSQ